ncbi:hypothetical protein EXN24_25425 [Rhizobium rhizogenes]|uniref:Uncharacterized protein n=1 Tax=Rhizobium rhizogenes TaxID=359 RepID=A0AA94V8R3_RHIRH|nr:hypothetical protein EXN24_25425 [Rhizobium rhizogenes]HCV74020.1 hypothetical protein [Agrobacterium sp.]
MTPVVSKFEPLTRREFLPQCYIGSTTIRSSTHSGSCRLNVVPATGTCDRVDMIGRLREQ